MKFNKEEYKEQVKDQVWNKFKWSLISVLVGGVILLAALSEDREMYELLTRPFYKSDKLTEAQIKKYLRYACVRNTIEYAQESDTDYPDGWTEKQLDDFHESIRVNCPQLADEWYEDAK